MKDRQPASRTKARTIVIDEAQRARWAELRAAGEAQSLTVGRLYDQLVGTWRTDLLQSQEAEIKKVADSLSASIATQSLGALALANVPKIALPEFGSQIAEAMSAYQVGIGRAVAESLAASIRPIAIAATSSFSAWVQQANADEIAAEQALWKMGWWMPQSVSMSFFARVGKLAVAGKRVEVRKAMVSLGRSRHFRNIIDAWLELDPYRDRRRFLLDGLADHRRGRFRVSIPTLLPLIEGIAVEAFTPGATHGPRPALEAAALADAATGPAMADTVTALYARHDFSAVASGSRQLNRHLILHGRSTGYGTEENSVKVLLALDILAYFIEERERSVKTAEPKSESKT